MQVQKSIVLVYKVTDHYPCTLRLGEYGGFVFGTPHPSLRLISTKYRFSDVSGGEDDEGPGKDGGFRLIAARWRGLMHQLEIMHRGQKLFSMLDDILPFVAVDIHTFFVVHGLEPQLVQPSDSCT